MAKKQNGKDGNDSGNVAIINNEALRDKIYTIRGKQVMLDYDLAEIYGYTTSAFNQQVSRNIEKFEGDEFMFQLTKRDIDELLICKNNTSISQNVISIQTRGMKGGRAKKSIAIVDNYINIRSLRLLQEVRAGVKITIFSDNLGHYLHQSDYDDFRQEFPELEIDFVTTDGKIHDRFIMLDSGLESERIYQCGASSKDAGRKLMLIHEIEDGFVKDAMRGVMERMMGNKKLQLG